MAAPATIDDLMREGPWQWGVRGDPHLWNDMRERLAGVPCPATAEELVAVIEREFEALTGQPMSAPDYVRVDRYDHGGMSGGLVSPRWWREKAIPLLRERHPGPSETPEPVPVSALFTPEPGTWGLRGDPWLWRDMRERFAAVPCPATGDALAAIVTAEFERLTGHPVTHGEMIHLEQYAHGGMSSGMVWPEFWRDTAIPLLRKRHAELIGQRGLQLDL